MSTQITIASKLPYKSYVALLTQNGSEDKQEYIVNFGEVPGLWPNLPIGTTLVILQNDSKSDFTISGAPNNVAGTWFIYNGIPPKIFAPERAGGIVDIGYDLGAPIATVLENTIGNIWWTYNGAGTYNLNSLELFINDKTYCQNVVLSQAPTFLYHSIIEPTTIEFLSTDGDDILRSAPLEIRVYN